MKKFFAGVLIGAFICGSMIICKNHVEKKYEKEIENIKKIERKAVEAKEVVEEVKENLAMIVDPLEIEELEVVNEYEISVGYDQFVC